MARTAKVTPTTEWGRFILGRRMKTTSEEGHYVGSWPVSRKAFAEWLSEKVGTSISYSTYVSWEMGYREPAQDMQDKIRMVLATATLPGAAETPPAPPSKPPNATS